MPTYDYRCEKCGEDLEVYQSFSDAPLTKHQGCGGKLRKVLSPAGIVLKGSGFYKTDNRGASKGKGKDKTKDNGKESTTSTADSSSSSTKPASDTSSTSGASSTKSTEAKSA